MTQDIHLYWPADLVAGGAVNCRPNDDDVSDLVASIAAHGLLQPLVGRLIADETIEIIDGNRRLKALQQLHADGKLTEQIPVMLRAEEPDADAFEISLAANVLRKPLHPVAEYEAFVQLSERGKTVEQIAEHFGITVRQVEQRQALGRLHPDVRRAWLDGTITGEAARAFTLAPLAEQAAYLARATNTWDLRWDTIRRIFSGQSAPGDSPMAIFVGEEAYLAAGGEMVPDLFVEPRAFASAELLRQLAGDKLKTEAERIAREEGWAEGLTDAEATGRHSWDRLPKPALPDDAKPQLQRDIEARLIVISTRGNEIDDLLADTYAQGLDDEEQSDEVKALLAENDAIEAEREKLQEEQDSFDDAAAAWMQIPADRRAKAIVVVDINRDGALDIARGYLKNKKPAPPPKPTAMARPTPTPSADNTEAPEPVKISAALMDDLALAATRAAAHVLAGEPRIALAAFVASAVCYGGPLRIEHKGQGEGPSLPWPARSYEHRFRSFGEVFRDALRWDEVSLQMQAARAIAHTLDFTSKALTSNSYDTLQPAAVTDLRASLPADTHRAALVKAFEPATYFASAPKPEALAAIADCGDDPGKYSKLKKGDLAAVATRLADEHAWLPPLLRGEVFEATIPPVDDQAEPADETPAEPLSASEEHQSAAEAALKIWQDQDGAEPGAEEGSTFDLFDTLKTPELRARLKAAGITVPFGSTREAILELARASERTPAEEAA
jgi:ParB family chromosome partitioning protein